MSGGGDVVTMDVERLVGEVIADQLDKSDRQVKLVQPVNQGILVYGIKDLGEVERYHGGYSFAAKVGRDNIRYLTQLEDGGVTSPESELVVVDEVVFGNIVSDFFQGFC